MNTKDRGGLESLCEFQQEIQQLNYDAASPNDGPFIWFVVGATGVPTAR